jgi:hypothetical protein
LTDDQAVMHGCDQGQFPEKGKVVRFITRGRVALLSGITAAGLAVGFPSPALALETIHIPGGYGLWSADPANGLPGDATMACDTAADGWGIRVTLSSVPTHRWVTTQGHASPYCTPWQTGNLPEGTAVTITVEQVKKNSSGVTTVGASYSVKRTA